MRESSLTSGPRAFFPSHSLKSAPLTMTIAVLFLVILTLLPRESVALFKDQAGKWDWRQSYIGHAKFLESDATQSGVKRIYVATHDNAVAAINARFVDKLLIREMGNGELFNN